MELGIFCSVFVSLILVFSAFLRVSGNSEGVFSHPFLVNLMEVWGF